MVDGMEVRQFLKFRMTLLPASGFQSAQMRKIEFCCTDALHLVAEQKRAQFSRDTPVHEVYQDLYWRFGATELKTGKQTLTLRQFEEKYKKHFIATAEKYRNINLWQLYLKHYTDVESTEQIQKALRELDALANVDWRLAHYKSAVRYLQRETETIAATGGTNWQKYLPPRFQRQQFFPELWNEEEKAEWGKRWVVENVGQRPKK
jgi:tryptophan 2,3-dioxygenase